MSWFKSVGNWFQSEIIDPIGHAATDVYNGAKTAVSDVYNAGKTGVTTIYNGAVSGVNRAADLAEKAANTGIDTFGGIGKILSNPLLVAGGLIVALIVISKLDD